MEGVYNHTQRLVLRLRCIVFCAGVAGKSPTADYISKLEVRVCHFLVSVYSLDTGIPAVYCVLSNYS